MTTAKERSIDTGQLIQQVQITNGIARPRRISQTPEQAKLSAVKCAAVKTKD